MTAAGVDASQIGDNLDGPVGPTARSVWRAARVPVALGVLVVVVFTIVVLATATGHGVLDPRSADLGGGRAIATLLRDRGVQVERVTSVSDVARRASARSTVLVPFPDALPDGRLAALAALPAGVDLVVLDPGSRALRRVAPTLRRRGSTPVGTREPACALRAARTAGVVQIGGSTYDAVGAKGTVLCYASGGSATLAQVRRPAGGTVTVLGSGQLLTNEALDEDGDAALALALLGGADPARDVLWLLPSPGAVTATKGEQTPLLDLIPGRVEFAVLQLAIAVALLALWRARRLGPVVREPLPVVVRAAETVEGRGRLYRAAGARERAAAALRAGARARILPALGLPASGPTDAVVDAVADRAGADRAGIGALLYGAAPGDDAALTRFAADLDRLVHAVLEEDVEPRPAPTSPPPPRGGRR